MGRTACTELQCLYKGATYVFTPCKNLMDKVALEQVFFVTAFVFSSVSIFPPALHTHPYSYITHLLPTLKNLSSCQWLEENLALVASQQLWYSAWYLLQNVNPFGNTESRIAALDCSKVCPLRVSSKTALCFEESATPFHLRQTVPNNGSSQ